MAKQYVPLSHAEERWIKKTFNKKEIEVIELIFGGIPLDETFIRNNDKFKQAMKNNPPDIQ